MAMSLSVGATLSFIINVWPRFDNNRRARVCTWYLYALLFSHFTLEVVMQDIPRSEISENS
jgi:hypothetical protein